MAGGKESGPIKNVKEIILQETVVRLCPECDAEIVLEAGIVYDCDIQICPDCGYELETAFFDPENQAEVQKLLSRAIKQGSKKEERYDGSKLNLTKSPTLIPAPQEEEDFGQ